MPGEILLAERLLTRPALFEVLGDWKPALTPLANPRFDSDAARRRLESFTASRHSTASAVSAEQRSPPPARWSIMSR